MRPFRSLPIVCCVIAILTIPESAHANVYLPGMFFLVGAVQFWYIALAVWLIETLVLWKILHISFGKALLLSLLTNVLTTFLGEIFLFVFAVLWPWPNAILIFTGPVMFGFMLLWSIAVESEIIRSQLKIARRVAWTAGGLANILTYVLIGIFLLNGALDDFHF